MIKSPDNVNKTPKYLQNESSEEAKDAKDSQKTSIASLPQEMLEEIFSYLNIQDQCYFSQTSKENWHKARWKPNIIDSLPQEIFEEVFLYLDLSDWSKFSESSKRMEYKIRQMLNTTFIRKQKKEYIWLKDEKDNYKPYNAENIPIEYRDKNFFSEKAGTRELFQYSRVTLGGKDLIASRCHLKRKARTFNKQIIKKLCQLPKDIFVNIEGYKINDKASIFYYSNWDYSLSDLYNKKELNDKKELLENRFLIFRKIIKSMKELRNFKIISQHPDNFVVIKNKGKDGKEKFDLKRRIPLWAGFESQTLHSVTNGLCANNIDDPKIWMSPEVIYNQFILLQQEAREANNVYCFGLTMWFIYTQEIPFKGEHTSGYQWMNKVVNEGLRPDLSREKFPDLNEKEYTRLKELLEKTWKNNPEDRLTFEDIEKELNALEDASRPSE